VISVRGFVAGVWLILPTYNEADNLDPIVRAVLPRLEATGLPYTILVVDDGSPDGTGEIAERLGAELPAVRVLHLVMEMDADFSHDPADVPRLIAAAGAADLALGSRYVTGGGVENWGPLRRLISRGGCAYARLVLGIPVRDLTGGFKCFNRRVLEGLDLSQVHANGYGFQIELTYRAVRAGYTVTEVPIVFGQRRMGVSKMTPPIALEAVWKVLALRLRR
jgi:dolichol-phosphate mannosyltransferase